MIEWFNIENVKPANGDVCIVLFKEVRRAIFLDGIYQFSLFGSISSLRNITHWAYLTLPKD
jgi:hypothetical protein